MHSVRSLLCKMSIRRAKAMSTSTRRKIISNPYDSDSDISFVHPYGDKKCAVRFPTLMDKISNNTAGLKTFGNSLALHANHAIQTFVASDSEGSGGDSYDSAERARRARKKAIKLILDKAGSCAASLRAVADEVPEACDTANNCLSLIRNDDESSSSSSSDDERPTRRMRNVKVSEAKPHDGNLYEDISVTTDAQSYLTEAEDCSSIESERSNKSWSSDSIDIVKPIRKSRPDKLRRRRKQFLRRRAMEHAAGAETEDDDESSFHFGGPRLGLKKKSWDVPSQELRVIDNGYSGVGVLKEQKQTLPEASFEVVIPDLVNTSNENEYSLLNTTNEFDDDFHNGVPSLPLTSVVPGLADAQSQSLGLSTRSNNHLSPPSQLKWQSMEKMISCLSHSPMGHSYNFLSTSHLGPSVTQTPCNSLGEIIQLGDVIIRLNGKDVRSLDAKTVSEMISNMTGESVHVTFLRKNMLL